MKAGEHRRERPAGSSPRVRRRGLAARRRRLLLLLATTGCTNRLFLHPSHDPIATPAQRIEIEGTRAIVRRRPIEAFQRELQTDGGQPRVYVLAFTGNAGRAERQLDAVPPIFATWLEDGGPLSEGGGSRRGMAVVTVNYPGFGSAADPGPATLRRLGAAALDAYDHVYAMADGAPVVVYGISMGTTAALHVAASRPHTPPAGLVLDRGPDLPRLVMSRFGWWNLWLAAGPVALSLPRSARSVANARRVERVPALFLLGTRDTLVGPRNGYRVARRYRGPKRVVWLDIGHGSSVYAPEHHLGDDFEWLWRRIDED